MNSSAGFYGTLRFDFQASASAPFRVSAPFASSTSPARPGFTA
jgi:hypothetical protein